jgi:hypothetical protein
MAHLMLLSHAPVQRELFASMIESLSVLKGGPVRQVKVHLNFHNYIRAQKYAVYQNLAQFQVVLQTANHVPHLILEISSVVKEKGKKLILIPRVFHCLPLHRVDTCSRAKLQRDAAAKQIKI